MDVNESLANGAPAFDKIPGPRPFEIVEKDGLKIASDGARQVILLDASEGRMFKRRAIKRVGSSNAESIEWCVVELNGVRVYVDGENVVVTTRDLQP